MEIVFALLMHDQNALVAGLGTKKVRVSAYKKTESYGVSHILLKPAMSEIASFGEYMDIDWAKLHDETYRWRVVSALMRDHQDAITQFCTTRLGEGLAEEIVQEVFVTVWEGLPHYEQRAPLRNWLFGIARNRCQRAYRDRSRRQTIAQTFVDEIRSRSHGAKPVAPEEVAIQSSQVSWLSQSMTRLRDEDRIVITLRYWKDLPVAEIADIIGKSESATRRRLNRAQQRLKEFMDAAMDV